VQHNADYEETENWLHKHLVANHDRVIGVDYLADEVQTLNEKGYEVYQADVETMTLSVSADTVVAGELIEHVANPGKMLDRVREHLKEGGSFVLSTPNPWAFVHLRRHIDGSYDINHEHVAWYGPQTLRQLLNRHGFEIEAMYTVGPNNHGITAYAKRFGSDLFGGLAWIVHAKLDQ